MKKNGFIFCLVAAILVFGFILTSCDTGVGGSGNENPGNNNPGNENPGWTGNPNASEGLYIGIISFAGDANDLTSNSPVFMDAAGKDNLINYLNSSYTISGQSGTALFYGVHKALSNLKSNESGYPANVDSVNVITFTDGLDNGSDGRSAFTPIEGKTFESPSAYAQYINGEISNRQIANKSVTAYSVGVRGNDVTDIAEFQNTLANIASPGKSHELTDFANVQTTFAEIADGLNIVHTNTSFTMVTTLLSSGTRVRMTFDVTGTDSDAAMASSKYIEGTINRTGTNYTFSDISYAGGLGSSLGSGPITGTVDNSEVNFVFTNITGYDPATDQNNTKQWTKVSGSSTWQVNSEYHVGGEVDTTVEQRSSIIYLVLDSSTSLNTTQVGQIRNAAISFINSLYDQAHSETPGGSGISNITYSGVDWPVQGDNRRKSPVIDHSQTTITRCNFTSTGTNAALTIHLYVSSENNYDYAFVGNLDSAASMTNYRERISGSTSKDITITVPSPGSHFVEIGYGKDGSDSSGSDCAWFSVE
jgi:hypothetical protein